MQLIEMTVSEGRVRLLYADAASRDESTEWMEFHLNSVGDDNRRLGVIQRVALQRLQDLVIAETDRLRDLANQIPG